MPVGRRTEDQKILDPDIFIKDFPLDPWTRDLWTNNFIQQGLNRLLGYSPTEKKWIRLASTPQGSLPTVPHAGSNNIQRVSNTGSLSASATRTVKRYDIPAIILRMDVACNTKDMISVHLYVDDLNMSQIPAPDGSATKDCTPENLYNVGGETQFFKLAVYDPANDHYRLILKKPMVSHKNFYLYVSNLSSTTAFNAADILHYIEV